jgi:hypothetical protein
MNKAELLEENRTLREALHRPERSRFTQRRADLLAENKEMREELARYSTPIDTAPRRPIKTPLRSGRLFRKEFTKCRACGAAAVQLVSFETLDRKPQDTPGVYRRVPLCISCTMPFLDALTALGIPLQ